jgi:hypothetical protein
VVEVRGRRRDTHRYEDGGRNRKDARHENVHSTSKMYSQNSWERYSEFGIATAQWMNVLGAWSRSRKSVRVCAYSVRIRDCDRDQLRSSRRIMIASKHAELRVVVRDFASGAMVKERVNGRSL